VQELDLHAGREPADPQPRLTDAHVRLEVRAALLTQPSERGVLARELEARGRTAAGTAQEGPGAGGSDVADVVEQHEEVVRTAAAGCSEALECAQVHSARGFRARFRVRFPRDGRPAYASIPVYVSAPSMDPMS